jgi:predicted amidophosphoribosyltransferase
VLWGEYDGTLRRAMLALKHRGRDELARPLAARLAARVAVAPWISEVGAVAAVPSHRLRQLRRGTCAAHLLADETARRLGLPLVTALQRHGFDRQQGRTRRQRLLLARGSFSARPAARGQGLLVVDDVSTTGTTLRRAAEALIHGGADSVYCAAIAHAPDPRRL